VAETFYETLSLAAFALLGLWWVVVADRRREWSVLPYRRRQAYSVSLYFTLTGIMSLVSLISEDHPALWRLAFGIAGAIGAAEVVLSLLRASSEPARERRGVVSVLLFLGINYGWLLFMEPPHSPDES
jgi:hypothetical protein